MPRLPGICTTLALCVWTLPQIDGRGHEAGLDLRWCQLWLGLQKEGTNASGKTGLGVWLAHKFNGEIISADSRQVFRGMDIGTGKDLADYCLQIPNNKSQITNKFQIQNSKSKTIAIPYHLIDVVRPNTEYNLAKWLRDAKGD